jgi:hypothetical protein
MAKHTYAEETLQILQWALDYRYSMLDALAPTNDEVQKEETRAEIAMIKKRMRAYK